MVNYVRRCLPGKKLSGPAVDLAVATVQRKKVVNPVNLGEWAPQAEQINTLLSLERGELDQPADEVFPTE